MRKSLVIAASLLFVITSAFAQQTTPSNTVSVFVSDLSVTHSSSSGTSFDAGYGAAFAHRFSDHISAELTVTTQRIRQSSTTVSPSGQAVFTSYTRTLLPFDANVSYHFFTNSRWKPYLGGGLRYVRDTVRDVAPYTNYRFTSRSVDPEVSGGVTYQFRPNLGLRFDAKQTIGSSNSVLGDAAFSVSAGLSFRF
ncbi:MAG TPA: OmpW family outer membrane protein [Thermoanaerobaculia bacterium]